MADNPTYQWIWGGLHWPPFGFRFTPKSWGLYAVYRWTLWLPFLEIRAWVAEGDVALRLLAIHSARETSGNRE